MLKYALVGVGTLGHTHLNASTQVMRDACTDVKLVALCDIREEIITEEDRAGKAKGCNIYTSVEDLLANEELDFVVTALPTYLHEKIGVQIMKKGIHLFSEKPMAINLEQAENMIKVANEMNVKLMIGQCSRYEPRNQKLKEIVDNKAYGNVIQAYFSRTASIPPMGWEGWFRDGAKSGGAALDLHVHDVDLVNYIFGMPKAVASIGTNYMTEHDFIRSLYYYEEDIAVNSLCEWGRTISSPGNGPTFSFRFEKGIVNYERGKMTFHPEDDKEVQTIEYVPDDSYALEVLDFIDCIVNDKKSAINPAESTLDSTRLALAEKKSADIKNIVML